jgi:hypothetical protein
VDGKDEAGFTEAKLPALSSRLSTPRFHKVVAAWPSLVKSAGEMLIASGFEGRWEPKTSI